MLLWLLSYIYFISLYAHHLSLSLSSPSPSPSPFLTKGERPCYYLIFCTIIYCVWTTCRPSSNINLYHAAYTYSSVRRCHVDPIRELIKELGVFVKINFVAQKEHHFLKYHWKTSVSTAPHLLLLSSDKSTMTLSLSISISIYTLPCCCSSR
jgi:hypothetical protein